MQKLKTFLERSDVKRLQVKFIVNRMANAFHAPDESQFV